MPYADAFWARLGDWPEPVALGFDAGVTAGLMDGDELEGEARAGEAHGLGEESVPAFPGFASVSDPVDRGSEPEGDPGGATGLKRST